MRLATKNDLPELSELYSDALVFANSVGHIDWPDPFTLDDTYHLVKTSQLYCFGDERIDGAALISPEADNRIWEDTRMPAIYIGKLATS